MNAFTFTGCERGRTTKRRDGGRLHVASLEISRTTMSINFQMIDHDTSACSCTNRTRELPSVDPHQYGHQPM